MDLEEGGQLQPPAPPAPTALVKKPLQAKTGQGPTGFASSKEHCFFNTDVTSRVVKRFHTLRHMGAKSRKLPRTEQRCFQLLASTSPF